MNFNEIVKKSMADRKIRPSDLARATGYSQQYMGHRRWNETTIDKVSQVLGIEVIFAANASTQPTGTDGPNPPA